MAKPRPGDSTLRAEVASVLREYLANYAVPEDEATVIQPSPVQKKRKSKAENRAIQARNIRKPAAVRVGSSAQRTCLACGSVVTFGIVTDKVVLHSNASGMECIGSHRSRKSTAEPAQKDTLVTMKRTKGKAVPAPVPANGKQKSKAQASVKDAEKNRTTARRSRRVNSRYYDEFGGENSVRSVSGGMPGHGRRS